MKGPPSSKRGRRRRQNEYLFEGFRFIPHRQLLYFGDKPLRVGSRSLDLLHLLVSRAGEVVSKKDLVDFAWPGTHIHESNLKVNIAALRRAMPRGTSESPLIVNIPGRGYRFVASVQVLSGKLSETVPEVVRNQSGQLPKLPAPIGRDQAIDEVRAKLLSGPIVTIVGPAGVGKTTLALAAAQTLIGSYRDGVRFVDLAVIDDGRLAGATIATVLGITGEFSDPVAVLVEALQQKEMLLILDNCEHVLSATAAIVDEFRSIVPGVHVLATSREPLRLRAETLYHLAPLTFPTADDAIGAERALAYSAVRLFVSRAQEMHGFVFTDEVAPIVCKICRRLDGIALAIEFAVARLETWDPAALFDALETSFTSLDPPPNGDNPRHRTLMATLGWSYKLLSDDDARMFRLLSVFNGTFSLEDIIGVAGGAGTSVEHLAATTENLVAKSLLAIAYERDGLRYRLLDSNRAFAAEALIVNGEAALAHSRFAQYLLDVFERADTEWQWRARKDWTGSYAPRANDLRKALEWAFGPNGDEALGVRLTAAAASLWDELSIVSESRYWVERSQKSPFFAAAASELRMKVITSFASALNFSDHLGVDAESAWREGRHLALNLDNIDYQLRTLWGLAVLQSFSGRHLQALDTLEQFRITAEVGEERSALPDGERLRLMTRFYCGNIADTHRDMEILARDFGAAVPQSRIARFQIDRSVGMQVALSLMRWMRGEHAGALAMIEGALDRAEGLGHLLSHSNALAQSALPLALFVGDARLAWRYSAALAHNLNLREIAIWGPVERFYRGAIASLEADPSGPKVMRGAIDELERNNFLVRTPMYHGLTAEAALKAGHTDLARHSLTEAFARAEAQDERWWQPELLRVRSLLDRYDGDMAGAELSLALAICRSQESGALSLELRSATALAELLSVQGRQAEAANILAPVLVKFDATSPSQDVRFASSVLNTAQNNI